MLTEARNVVFIANIICYDTSICYDTKYFQPVKLHNSNISTVPLSIR